MANTMSKVSQKVQYESSLMGTTLILISITMTWIFYVFFTSSSTLTKVFILINAIAGYLIMSSMLVTTYQQYQQYMGTIALLKFVDGRVEGEKRLSGKKIKVIRYISGAIEIAIIIFLSWLLNFWYISIALIHPLYLIMSTNKYIQKQEDLTNV